MLQKTKKQKKTHFYKINFKVTGWWFKFCFFKICCVLEVLLLKNNFVFWEKGGLEAKHEVSEFFQVIQIKKYVYKKS